MPKNRAKDSSRRNSGALIPYSRSSSTGSTTAQQQSNTNTPRTGNMAPLPPLPLPPSMMHRGVASVGGGRPTDVCDVTDHPPHNVPALLYRPHCPYCHRPFTRQRRNHSNNHNDGDDAGVDDPSHDDRDHNNIDDAAGMPSSATTVVEYFDAVHASLVSPEAQRLLEMRTPMLGPAAVRLAITDGKSVAVATTDSPTTRPTTRVQKNKKARGVSSDGNDSGDDQDDDGNLSTPASSPASGTGGQQQQGGGGADPPSFYQHFFEEVTRLGKGSFGGVFLCRHVVGGELLGLYAVKKVPVGDDPAWLHRALSEVKILQGLRRHPNCIQYFYSWVEMSRMCDFGPAVRCLFILQEFAELGTMDGFMEGYDNFLPDDAVWCFFLMALEGLAHLHSQGILHRDLKPENFLLARNDSSVMMGHHTAAASVFGGSRGAAADDTDAGNARLHHHNRRLPVLFWPRLMLADFGTAALVQRQAKDNALVKFMGDVGGTTLPAASSFHHKPQQQRTSSNSSAKTKPSSSTATSPHLSPTLDDASERTGATGTQNFMADELFILVNGEDDSVIDEEGNRTEKEHQPAAPAAADYQNKCASSSTPPTPTSPTPSSPTAGSKHYKYTHTVQSDLFSLGMCLHFMAYEGTLPTNRRRVRKSASRIDRPVEMIRLIEALIRPNPMHRPASCDMILRDPFCIKLKKRLGLMESDDTAAAAAVGTDAAAAGASRVVVDEDGSHAVGGSNNNNNNKNEKITPPQKQSSEDKRRDDDGDACYYDESFSPEAFANGVGPSSRVDVLASTWGSMNDLRSTRLRAVADEDGQHEQQQQQESSSRVQDVSSLSPHRRKPSAIFDDGDEEDHHHDYGDADDAAGDDDGGARPTTGRSSSGDDGDKKNTVDGGGSDGALFSTATVTAVALCASLLLNLVVVGRMFLSKK